MDWFQTVSISMASVRTIAAGASHAVERMAGVRRPRTPSHVDTLRMIHNVASSDEWHAAMDLHDVCLPETFNAAIGVPLLILDLR